MREDIFLRELSKEDIPKLNAWRNNPDLISSLGTGFRYISEEVDETWFQDYLDNRDKAVRLAIVAEGNYVGNINLTNINTTHRNAEFSILIGDDRYRGKGIGFYVSTKILEHGFKDLGLKRIWLTVVTTNDAALKLYSRIGFKEEGILRTAIYKNGTFLDLKIMSILN